MHSSGHCVGSVKVGVGTGVVVGGIGEVVSCRVNEPLHDWLSVSVVLEDCEASSVIVLVSSMVFD